MTAVGAIAVADLQVHGVGGAAVDELVPILGARREARAHPGREPLLARLGAQHHLAFQHEYEFVLVRVPVAHGGFLAGWQYGVVDADTGEPERIADAAFRARQHPRAIGLGVTAAVDGFDGAWIEGRFAR